MRAFLLLAPVLLTTGCATVPDRTPWLAGLWLGMDEGVEYPLACASGLAIRYTANGRYLLVEERGTWRLDGDWLTETATEIAGEADEGAPQVGRAYVSRIVREGADSFLKTFAEGGQMRFRRCP